jgi:hypothetical protein
MNNEELETRLEKLEGMVNGLLQQIKNIQAGRVVAPFAGSPVPDQAGGTAPSPQTLAKWTQRGQGQDTVFTPEGSFDSPDSVAQWANQSRPEQPLPFQPQSSKEPQFTSPQPVAPSPPSPAPVQPIAPSTSWSQPPVQPVAPPQPSPAPVVQPPAPRPPLQPKPGPAIPQDREPRPVVAGGTPEPTLQEQIQQRAAWKAEQRRERIRARGGTTNVDRMGEPFRTAYYDAAGIPEPPKPPPPRDALRAPRSGGDERLAEFAEVTASTLQVMQQRLQLAMRQIEEMRSHFEMTGHE